MTSINKKNYLLLSIIWLFLISFLTIFKYAPQWLNADVLMNSVMSLQKLTLFYWGQNRLLNIVPAATAFIKNPGLNLAAVLFIASFSFYLFLFAISRFVAFVINPSNPYFLSLKIFVVISTVFVSVFYSNAIFEIAIWHVEYSFAALLLSISVYFLILNRKNNVWNYLLSIAAIVLAIGINPSVIIPAVFIAVAVIVYRRKISVSELILVFSSLISFFIWNFVSKQYGTLPYNKFDINLLPIGLERVFNGFLTVFNLPVLLFLIGLLACIKLLFLLKRKGQRHEVYDMENYIIYSIVIFSTIWFLLFSSSHWIEINLFSWRYFIFVIFGFLVVVAIEIGKIFNEMKPKYSIVLTGMFFLVTMTAIFSAPASFNNYAVFNHVNNLSKPGNHLYSGDYWLVWPSVLRDLMQGYEAYGLTHRGEANNEAAKQYVFEKIKNDGNVMVICLNDKPENCINQINSVVGPIHASEPEFVNDQVYKIKITD